MVVLAYRKLWCFSTAKINFITHFFLEILQRFCKILILGNVGMPSYDHQSWWHLLVENFIVRQKAKFIPHPEILHRYCKIGMLCTLHKHRHILQKQYQLKDVLTLTTYKETTWSLKNHADDYDELFLWNGWLTKC